MNTFSKILVTIVAIAVFTILFALLCAITDANGQTTPGLLGIVFLAALIGALRAIWKKGKKEQNNQ